jgi:uncharacterized protein with von Willebrand factor type A (vWA) domain
MTAAASDIVGALLPDAVPVVGGGGAADGAPAVAQSPTVLAVGRWARLRGDRAAAEWRDVGAPVGGLPDAEHVAADAIELLTSAVPQWADAPADRRRADYWRDLSGAPDISALRDLCSADPLAADVAAAAIADGWRQWAASNPPPSDGEGGGGDDGKGGGAGDDPAAAARRALSARRAVEQAASDAADAAAFGRLAGTDEGQGGEVDRAAAVAAARAALRNPAVRAVLRRLGELLPAMRSARRARRAVERTPAETVGVTLGGDPSRLVPSELAALRHPVLRRAALVRLVEGRATVWDRRDRPRADRGPVVVSVDESGSMGDPTSLASELVAAKAIALAVATLAAAEGRPCVLTSFGTGAEWRAIASDRRGRFDPRALSDWLARAYGGGTDAIGPLSRSLAEAERLAVAGHRCAHLIISDGQVTAAASLVEAYRRRASSIGLRTVVYLTASERAGGGRGWQSVADDVRYVPRVSAAAESAAVDW